MHALTKIIPLLLMLSAAALPLPAASLTAEDFAGLSYNDPSKDDYTFYGEAAGSDDNLTSSCGVKGQYPYVDILHLEAAYDQATDNVKVTVELANQLMFGGSMNYYICFVDAGYRQDDSLLKPQEVKGASFDFEYYDSKRTFCRLSVGPDYDLGRYTGFSTPSMQNLSSRIETKSITYTFKKADLEGTGVKSDFGLYAICTRMESGMNPGFCQLTWDTAGLGAAAAPAEFNTAKWEEFHGGGKSVQSGAVQSLLPLILIVIVIAVAAAGAGGYVHMKRKRAAKEAILPPKSPPGPAIDGEEKKRKEWADYEKLYGRPHPDSPNSAEIVNAGQVEVVEEPEEAPTPPQDDGNAR